MEEGEIVHTFSVLEPNQEPSKIHRDESVFVKGAISRNIWSVLILSDRFLMLLILFHNIRTCRE